MSDQQFSTSVPCSVATAVSPDCYPFISGSSFLLVSKSQYSCLLSDCITVFDNTLFWIEFVYCEISNWYFHDLEYTGKSCIVEAEIMEVYISQCGQCVNQINKKNPAARAAEVNEKMCSFSIWVDHPFKVRHIILALNRIWFQGKVMNVIPFKFFQG